MLYRLVLQKANEFRQFYVKVLLPFRKWKYEVAIKNGKLLKTCIQQGVLQCDVTNCEAKLLQAMNFL
jgi:hypothetical protein